MPGEIPPAGRLALASIVYSPAAQVGYVLSQCQLLTRTQIAGNVPPRRQRAGGSQRPLLRRSVGATCLLGSRRFTEDNSPCPDRGDNVYVLHLCAPSVSSASALS